jgi:hypothetical protein
MRKLVLLLSLLFTACGGGTWIKVEGLYESPSHNYSVVVPQGWKKLDTERYFLITKDDPFLHYILIQERGIERPFKHTKKKLKHGMLSQEAAKVIIDEISSDQFVRDFEVLENIPVMIGPNEGFKLIFKYRTRSEQMHRTIYYGFVNNNFFYSIRYNASESKYAEKDKEVFETILNSFKVIDEHPT